LAELDYVALVDPLTLEPPAGELTPGTTYRLLTAARLGIPRLLDNLALLGLFGLFVVTGG